MNVKFKRLDEKIPLIENAANEIIECVLNNDSEEFFQVFANTLLSCSTYKANTFIKDKIIKRLDQYKMLYPQISKELENFKDLLWNYFSYIDDFEFNSLLRRNSDYYKNMITEQQKLNKLRGVLFEVLIESIIRPRYSHENFETGCVIIINGKKVISYYSGKARKTIDIASCQEGYGEFYECKLSPNSLNAESYQYLNLLENRMNKVTGLNSLVGCVTLGDKLSLENAKVQIEEELGIHNADIMLYGCKEILLLKKSPFREAV